MNSREADSSNARKMPAETEHDTAVRALEPDTRSATDIGIPAVCCTLEISGAEQAKLVTMFKALGNPVRFEIMKFLVTRPGCITGDIVDYLPIAQSTVSQHLKVLRDAGWIEGNISGAAVNYCLHAKNIAWFKAKVGDIF